MTFNEKDIFLINQNQSFWILPTEHMLLMLFCIRLNARMRYFHSNQSVIHVEYASLHWDRRTYTIHFNGTNFINVWLTQRVFSVWPVAQPIVGEMEMHGVAKYIIIYIFINIHSIHILRKQKIVWMWLIAIVWQHNINYMNINVYM